MKKLIVKKSIIAGSYLFMALLFEIITFLVIGMGFMPQYFGLDLAVLVLFAFFIFAIPSSIAQIIIVVLLLGCQMIISIANEALYSMGGMVFSFGMLNLTNELGGVFDNSFLNIGLIVGLVILFAATAAGLITVGVKLKVGKFHIKCSLIIMVISLIVMGCCAGTYAGIVKSFNNYAEDDMQLFLDEISLYNEQLFPAKAYQKFGTFGYYGRNIINAASSSTAADDITAEELDEFFASGKMSSEVYGDNIYTGTLAGKNVVLIVIESGEWFAINKEYTPTLYAMAEQGLAMTHYYDRDKTNVSEALSIMGSYPSKTQLEPAYVKDNTMSYTLANILKNDGYTTNYFHANEGSFYKRNETFNGLYGFDNTYFLDTMPLLKGYTEKTSMFDFYAFDKDSDIFKLYSDEYTKTEDGDNAFFTQHMTLTTHGKYTDLEDYGNYPFTDVPSSKGGKSVNLMSEKQMAEFSANCTVKDLEEYYVMIDSFPSTFVTGTYSIDEDYLEENGIYSQTFLYYKRFQAGMTDLDAGVNSIICDLKAKNELDDTLFVFYADHSAYYNDLNALMKGIDPTHTYNSSIYNVPCFMWYGGSMNLNVAALPVEGYSDINYSAADTGCALKGGIIDKFTCSFDVLPTILHLTGHDFNVNLYHGNSFLSNEVTLFRSHESGIFNENIYFSTIELYERGAEGWTCYDFESTYLNEGFGDGIMAFLYEALDYYHKELMLEAVITNDYFAVNDIYDCGIIT